MNQKNQPNNHKHAPKNPKKYFFILIISGIVAAFLLIAVIFFVKKFNYKNNQPADGKETGSEANHLPT
jgi:flagellar basal body-associated protein FliL